MDNNFVIIFAVLLKIQKVINKHMLVVPVKEGENIERALKKYKKKFEKTGVMRELRKRKEFIKPSVKIRQQRIKAAYKQRILSDEI